MIEGHGQACEWQRETLSSSCFFGITTLCSPPPETTDGLGMPSESDGDTFYHNIIFLCVEEGVSWGNQCVD